MIQRRPWLLRIGAVAQGGLQIGGGGGDMNRADRPRRALQLMDKGRRIRRKLRQSGCQRRGLACEHRQNLAFEAAVAERHAAEMVEIDRAIVWNQWRRRHPGNLLKKIRHCCNPGPLSE